MIALDAYSEAMQAIGFRGSLNPPDLVLCVSLVESFFAQRIERHLEEGLLVRTGAIPQMLSEQQN